MLNRLWGKYILMSVALKIDLRHGWFVTSHAWILEHRELRVEVGLCSLQFKKKGKLTKPRSSPKGPHIRLHC